MRFSIFVRLGLIKGFSFKGRFFVPLYKEEGVHISSDDTKFTDNTPESYKQKLFVLM